LLVAVWYWGICGFVDDGLVDSLVIELLLSDDEVVIDLFVLW